MSDHIFPMEEGEIANESLLDRNIPQAWKRSSSPRGNVAHEHNEWKHRLYFSPPPPPPRQHARPYHAPNNCNQFDNPRSSHRYNSRPTQRNGSRITDSQYKSSFSQTYESYHPPFKVAQGYPSFCSGSQSCQPSHQYTQQSYFSRKDSERDQSEGHPRHFRSQRHDDLASTSRTNSFEKRWRPRAVVDHDIPSERICMPRKVSPSYSNGIQCRTDAILEEKERGKEINTILSFAGDGTLEHKGFVSHKTRSIDYFPKTNDTSRTTLKLLGEPSHSHKLYSSSSCEGSIGANKQKFEKKGIEQTNPSSLIRLPNSCLEQVMEKDTFPDKKLDRFSVKPSQANLKSGHSKFEKLPSMVFNAQELKGFSSEPIMENDKSPSEALIHTNKSLSIAEMSSRHNQFEKLSSMVSDSQESSGVSLEPIMEKITSRSTVNIHSNKMPSIDNMTSNHHKFQKGTIAFNAQESKGISLEPTMEKGTSPSKALIHLNKVPSLANTTSNHNTFEKGTVVLNSQEDKCDSSGRKGTEGSENVIGKRSWNSITPCLVDEKISKWISKPKKAKKCNISIKSIPSPRDSPRESICNIKLVVGKSDEQNKTIRCAVDEQKSKNKVHAHDVKNDNKVITNPILCTKILDVNSMGNQHSPSVVSDDGPYATESSFGSIQSSLSISKHQDPALSRLAIKAKQGPGITSLVNTEAKSTQLKHSRRGKKSKCEKKIGRRTQAPFASDSVSGSDSDTDEEEILTWAEKMFGVTPPALQKLRQSCSLETKNGSFEEEMSACDKSKTSDLSQLPLRNDSIHQKLCKPKELVCDSLKPATDDNASWEAKEERRKKEESRILTPSEIRAILGDDFETVPSSHWVRRSSRQPCKDALQTPGLRALLDKLRSDDSDMVVLKMKKYVNDPDTPQVVLDAVLDALEENTNCEALYIQNFNRGMRDEQILHLLRVLKLPSCKIWCLNIGETYNVKRSTWRKFTRGLRATKVTHMYASEHTIDGELKERIRSTIRENRKKHTLHCDPENLDTIVRCTHCWWNPVNARVLRPYLKKKGYEGFLRDTEAQGLEGSISGANLGAEEAEVF